MDPSKNANSRMIDSEDNVTKHAGQTESDHDLTRPVNCGPPNMLANGRNFRQLHTSIFRSGLKHKQFNKYYELWGDRKTHSQGKVKPLICVIGRNKKPHLIHVWMKALNRLKPPFLPNNGNLTREKDMPYLVVCNLVVINSRPHQFRLQRLWSFR